jgi:hypothetical protein
VQFVEVVEDVGQIEYLELARTERAELGDRWREHLHRAELQRFHLLAVLEQRAVRIHLDLDAPLVRSSASFLKYRRPCPSACRARRRD